MTAHAAPALRGLTRALLADGASAIAASEAGATRVALPAAAMLDLPERAVQFGTGAFLRGFIDAFIDDANRRGAFNGRVAAVASTGSGRDAAFTEQDGLYTLILAGNRDGIEVSEPRVIGSVSRALSAASSWTDVLAIARNPLLSLVFSNTTEVGFALDERDAREDFQHESPRSFPAKLTRFLLERARTFDFDPSRGLVVMPCELLEDNGDALRALVQEQAARWNADARFMQWLAASVTFCNTLVDRIVPGIPDAAQHVRITSALGYDDQLLTMAEPFALLAIEGADALADRLEFTRGNPAIRVVPSVRPYRERKLRLLNGTHTALAALGVLAGVETVADAMHETPLGAWTRELLHADIVPALDVPDASAFADATLDRFGNRHVRHRLLDITVQGTLKFRVRLLPLMQRYADRGRPIPERFLLALAAQLALHHPEARAARARAGRDVSDDLAPRIAQAWERNRDATPAGTYAFVADALSDHQLWECDVRTLPGVAHGVARWLAVLASDGAMPAAQASMSSAPAAITGELA